MATGTGNLPQPNNSVSPFDIGTSTWANAVKTNIDSLATGTGIGDGAIKASNIDLATFIQNGFTFVTGTGIAFITGGSVTFTTPIPTSKRISIATASVGYKNTDPTGITDPALVAWESPQIGIKPTIVGGNMTGFSYVVGVDAGTIPSGRRIVYSWTAIAL